MAENEDLALPAEASPRKLQLLAVAYGRYLEAIPEFAGQTPVSHLGEQIADGQVTIDEVLATHVVYSAPHRGNIAGLVVWGPTYFRTRMALLRFASAQCGETAETPFRRELNAVRSYLRCIFGNPFRPVTLDPSWLTSTVVALARGIYDDRAFDRLPILADALQDAGCDNADVLNHCRDPKGVHARGCWVVDLLLGKA